MMLYTHANKEDLDGISNLLAINNLPFADLQESAIAFIVGKINNDIIGCIGLENYGTEGMLRSFAVSPKFRNKGIGKELYRQLINYAVGQHIKTIHLLTETARDYFAGKGFVVADRTTAPQVIINSIEFSTLCPVSSVYMVLKEIDTYAV
jgi:amino-acid N-acetyltransferase